MRVIHQAMDETWKRVSERAGSGETNDATRRPPLSPISERFPSSIHFSYSPSLDRVNPSRSCRRSPTVPACVVCCGDRILARAISILFVRWINRVSLPLSPSFSIRVIRSFGICVRKRPEFLNQIPRLEERIEKEDQEEKHCFGQ